jgi:hypothetical protein
MFRLRSSVKTWECACERMRRLKYNLYRSCRRGEWKRNLTHHYTDKEFVSGITWIGKLKQFHKLCVCVCIHRWLHKPLVVLIRCTYGQQFLRWTMSMIALYTYGLRKTKNRISRARRGDSARVLAVAVLA